MAIVIISSLENPLFILVLKYILHRLIDVDSANIKSFITDIVYVYISISVNR